MNNAISVLGLANKAGKIEAGEEPCGAAARAKWAKLIILAQDAADNTKRRAAHFALAGNCECIEVPFSKDDLGSIIGRTSCAVMAICDAGFASLFVSKLESANPGRYGAVNAVLREKAERAQQRKREKRAHEKNVRTGRKK